MAALLAAREAGALSIGTFSPTTSSYSISLGGLGGYGFVYEPRPPRPPVPPVTDPLILRHAGNDFADLAAMTPSGATSRVYRQAPGGSYAYRRTLTAGVRNEWRDTGLAPGTRYCYRLDMTNAGGTTRDYLCVTTPWRVEFTGAPMGQESPGVLRVFDWRDTQPLDEGDPSEPALYYMNVLDEDGETVRGLLDAGIHAQPMPVFPEEMEGFRGADTIAMQEGDPVGRWVYAVVPGSLFNEARMRALDQIQRGEAPGIRALVFRRVPVYAARALPLDANRLDYRYLADHDFRFLGEPECRSDEPCEAGLGWIVRKLTGWAGEGAEEAGGLIRRGLHEVKTIWHDEVTIVIELRALNTDDAFGIDTPMVSAWKGNELVLPGVGVSIRQGLGLVAGRADANGRVELTVLDDREATLCIDLSNDTAKLTEFLTDKTVCFDSFDDLGTRSFWPMGVRHPYVNVLASMSDADRWVAEKAGFDMDRVLVLVGPMADWLTLDNRSMTPCLGIGSHLIGNLSVLLDGVFAYTGAATEFLYSVDIGITQRDERSRGVAVHEYGHAVLCQMVRDSSESFFQEAWSDIVLAAADQSADNDTSYLNEAFADFLSQQIVGGTSYFRTEARRLSLDMSYSLPRDTAGAVADGLDRNYDEDDLTGLSTGFQAQVRRVASLLHDAFDGGVGVNDGTHWFEYSGTGSTGSLVRDFDDDQDKNDEVLSLPATALRDLIARADDRGDLISEGTLLGGLTDVLREAGHSDSYICAVFASHAGDGGCPGFVSDDPPIAGTVMLGDTSDEQAPGQQGGVSGSLGF